MKFAVMSDTHYISRSMASSEDMLIDIATSEQAVLQAAEQSDTIIITGDLTDEGDRPSHEDFARFLKGIKEKGKNVYVIFATHDFHHHRAYVNKREPGKNYSSKPWEMPYFNPDEYNGELPHIEEALTPEEIWDLYYEFGPEQAYSVCAPDFSYCIDIDEKTRCLMLNDIFRNEEALHDISASFTPGCFRWIKQMIDEAKRDGKYIFVCSHHPFLPAVPAHRIKTSNRNLRSPYTAHLLADMGINLAFTGHTHLVDIDYLTSDKNNILLDVASPSVRFFPPQYRMVEIDADAGTVNCEIVNVKVPESVSVPNNDLYGYYRKRMYNDELMPIKGKDNFVGKLLRWLSLGHLYFLAKKNAALSREERKKLKEINFADFIMELVFNMMTGDGKFTPDTVEYRFTMGLAAALDSIIDAQPFVDIRNKILRGYKITEIVEPMLYPDYIPNTNGNFSFISKPEKKNKPSVAKSHAGGILMTVVFILAVILCPLYPVVGIAWLIAKMVNKRKQLKINPDKPILRY